MDFSLTDEQQALRQEVIQFAQDHLNEGVRQRDREGIFRKDLWQQCAAFGIQGFNIPPSYGGQGKDLVTTLAAMEALGYGCRDNGLTFALNSHMWSLQPTLLHHASEVQKAALPARNLQGRYHWKLCHNRARRRLRCLQFADTGRKV
jgi:alkylation response protein AidB-like acyl-CoA dehydrogenase